LAVYKSKPKQKFSKAKLKAKKYGGGKRKSKINTRGSTNDMTDWRPSNQNQNSKPKNNNNKPNRPGKRKRQQIRGSKSQPQSKRKRQKK